MGNNVVDIGLLRRRKRIRKRILKLAIFLLLLLIVVFLYYNRDKWSGALEGIGSKYSSAVNSGYGKSDGGFPIKITGGADYQMKGADNSLAVLNDAYLYIYSMDGNLEGTRQHAYNNPIIQTAGKKILIYEHHGKRFRVDNKNKMLYEKNIEGNISFARISDEGYTAIVSSSETYTCVLTIYDPSGKEIYIVNQVDRVFDVCFNPGSSGCIIISIDASVGDIVSKIDMVEFNSKEKIWTEEYTLYPVQSYYTNEDGIFIIGDVKYVHLDNTGKLINEFVYADKLEDYSFHDGTAAVLMTNMQKRNSTLAIIKKDNTLLQIKFEGLIDSCDITKECIFLKTKTRNEVLIVDFDGNQLEAKEFQGSYNKIYAFGGNIFLMGYDKIGKLEE